MNLRAIRDPFTPFLRRLARVPLSIKLIALAVLAFAGVLSVSGYLARQSDLQAVQKNAEKDLTQIESILLSELRGYEVTSGALAITLAARKDVQSVYLSGDRAKASTLLAPVFSDLKARYNIVHLYLENPDGTVFLRVHNPTQLGDSVKYRTTVAATIETLRPNAGFEVGVNGPSVRGVAPMIKDGKLIGMVEVGIDFGQSFFENLSRQTGAQYTLWLYGPSTRPIGVKVQRECGMAPQDDFYCFAGTETSFTLFNAEQFRSAFQTLAPISTTRLENTDQPEAALLTPLLSEKRESFDQVFFGLIEIRLPYQQQLEQANAASRQAQGTRFAGSLLGILALTIAVNFVVIRPLGKLSQYAQKNISGQKVEPLELATGDEFESMAQSFNQMLAALQASRQEMEKLVEQRTAQLQTVNEVAREASSILDPDELITRVVNLITERFGYYYAAIFLNSENNRWAELKDATGTAGRILKARRHRLQIGGNSMVGAAIQNQEARLALDVGEAAVRFNNPLLPNTRSEIALPLIAGSHVLGALDVQSTRERDFKPEDIATLQSMANQVAIALENARLFRETNASLEELRQVNREFIASAWKERIQNNTLEYNTGFEAILAEEEGGGPHRLALPLKLREQAIGEIEIETSQEWNEEDRAWVEALATQLAISLENTRLLEESQQAALRERLSASIVQKIWAAGTVENILQTTVRELGRALEASDAAIELKVEE